MEDDASNDDDEWEAVHPSSAAQHHPPSLSEEVLPSDLSEAMINPSSHPIKKKARSFVKRKPEKAPPHRRAPARPQLSPLSRRGNYA